jgi:hypothetical protein
MGRAKRTRLWIALPGGIAINGLLLAVLVLVERAPPMMEDPSVVEISLERPEPRRKTQPSPSARMTSAVTTSHLEQPIEAAAAEVSTAPPQTAQAKPPVDPAWVVGGGAYLTPESGALARRFWDAADRRRYQRACIGLSSEHMTPEEKDRCWDAWGGAAARVAESSRGALAKPAPSRYDRDAAHQERCRTYRSKRTPGNTTSGSSLHFPGVSDGVPLSEGLC